MKLIKILILLPVIFAGCFLGLIFEAFKIGFAWGRDAVVRLPDSIIADIESRKANDQGETRAGAPLGGPER